MTGGWVEIGYTTEEPPRSLVRRFIDWLVPASALRLGQRWKRDEVVVSGTGYLYVGSVSTPDDELPDHWVPLS